MSTEAMTKLIADYFMNISALSARQNQPYRFIAQVQKSTTRKKCYLCITKPKSQTPTTDD